MKPTYWDQVIERYKVSGLKQLEFCSQGSIPINKFKYYWQKYRCRLIASKQSLVPQPAGPKFEPVFIEAKTSSNSISKSKYQSLSIKFSNEMVCSLDFEGSNIELAKFLKELAQL